MSSQSCTHNISLTTHDLINEKGKIDHIIERVISKDHAAQILEVWEAEL